MEKIISEGRRGGCKMSIKLLFSTFFFCFFFCFLCSCFLAVDDSPAPQEDDPVQEEVKEEVTEPEKK
jgi:hypothetical protein